MAFVVRYIVTNGRRRGSRMEYSGLWSCSLLLLTVLSTVSAAFYRKRPEATAVLVNHTATLYCAFDGLGPTDEVNWYWYNPETDDKLYHISARGRVASEFSRHSIVGSSRRGEYNLRIRDVQPADEGNYRCSVFTVRDAGDARLTVVVPPVNPPVIAGNLNPRTVGEALKLTCRSEGGKPLPHLMWYNGTTALEPIGMFYQEVSVGSVVERKLHIPFLTRWDNSANISCIADQGFPNVAPLKIATVRIKVHYPPTVITPRQTVQALEGGYANLTCIVRGNPTSVFSWRRVGDSLPQNAGMSNSSLLIPRVSRSDSGAYLCDADNGIQPVGTGEITLEVIYPPKIKSTFDQKISVLYGQEVFRVECQSEGNPRPRISWRRKDTKQPFDNPLTLSPLNYQTEGYYVCVARSDDFSEDTKETYVDVIGRPEIVSQSTSVSAVGGDTVELTCTIASDPEPDGVIWELAGRDGRKRQLRGGATGDISIKEVVAGEQTQSVLVITSAETVHTGNYACIASNMFGQDRQDFRVYVTEDSSDVVMIAAVTMGVVLGILFAIVLTLCLRARTIWASRLSKSEEELAVKPSLHTSCKFPNGLATIELQRANGITTHRPTVSQNTVVIPSPFTEVRAEHGRRTMAKANKDADDGFQRKCPYYIGELKSKQDKARYLPPLKRKKEIDEPKDVDDGDTKPSANQQAQLDQKDDGNSISHLRDTASSDGSDPCLDEAAVKCHVTTRCQKRIVVS
ncbi:kin of IRRE-like protein 3 [Branchiostoma floridae x Branchiostoma japonicum]